jgi:cysteinyl-tRNA synthetase
LILNSHYRNGMNFTWNALSGAKTALNTLRSNISKLQSNLLKFSNIDDEKGVNIYIKQFETAMDNDLNVSRALGIVWETLKSSLSDKEKYQIIFTIDSVLGLGLIHSVLKNQKEDIPEEIISLVEAREVFRREKKYTESDEVRKTIEKKGYYVEDNENGTVVKKKSS